MTHNIFRCKTGFSRGVKLIIMSFLKVTCQFRQGLKLLSTYHNRYDLFMTEILKYCSPSSDLYSTLYMYSPFYIFSHLKAIFPVFLFPIALSDVLRVPFGTSDVKMNHKIGIIVLSQCWCLLSEGAHEHQVPIAHNGSQLSRSLNVDRYGSFGNALHSTCGTEDDAAATLTLKLDDEKFYETDEGMLWLEAMGRQI